MDHELSLRKGDLFPSKKLRNTLIKLREAYRNAVQRMKVKKYF